MSTYKQVLMTNHQGLFHDSLNRTQSNPKYGN